MEVNYDNHIMDNRSDVDYNNHIMEISFNQSLAITPPPAIQAASFQELSNWCTVCYYEMNNRVGPPFIGNHAAFTIDGFTDPSSSERFCLGLLTNVNRDPTTEQTRRHIGKGVRIYKIGPAVYAECLSDAAIFVQSTSISKEYNFRPDYVYKVPSGTNIKIFNNAIFADLLTNSVNEGYEAVYALNEMCSIRMSFVKGWGPDYRRQKVIEAPSWIEIRLNGPLQWLDRILSNMGSSGAQCSSMS